MSLQVRLAVAADAAPFADLYRPYVEQTAITFETEAPDAREFLSRIRNITRLNPWITVTEQEEVIGYAYYHPFHSRAAYQWWAEISVYLRQDCRGRGIGTRLMSCLEECAAIHRTAVTGDFFQSRQSPSAPALRISAAGTFTQLRIQTGTMAFRLLPWQNAGCSDRSLSHSAPGSGSLPD